MKTIQVSVEDNLYDDLMTLIAQIPNDKIHIEQVIQPDTKPEVSAQEASDYVLKKNTELYERLA
ncbi:MAG: hypothetical protein V3U84_01680 [Thiotrichaceae bacterium]